MLRPDGAPGRRSGHRVRPRGADEVGADAAAIVHVELALGNGLCVATRVAQLTPFARSAAAGRACRDVSAQQFPGGRVVGRRLRERNEVGAVSGHAKAEIVRCDLFVSCSLCTDPIRRLD